MTNDTTTPTPPEVTTAAVIPHALPSDSLVLIGTFVTPAKATALVRRADGRISTVAIGDQLDEYTIAAIDDAVLYLADLNGVQNVLHIPSG